jgi:hypothetical protein
MFNGLFEKYSGIQVTGEKKDAGYTLLYKTTKIEPGFYINGLIHHNAETDAEAWIIENATKKVVAKLTIEKAPGRSARGFVDYDTGERIKECYADAGKALGKLIKKAG